MTNKYRVQVVMSWWQTIEVEANNEDEAGDKALDQFDIRQARMGEGECYDIEELKGTS